MGRTSGMAISEGYRNARPSRRTAGARDACQMRVEVTHDHRPRIHRDAATLRDRPSGGRRRKLLFDSVHVRAADGTIADEDVQGRRRAVDVAKVRIHRWTVASP